MLAAKRMKICDKNKGETNSAKSAPMHNIHRIYNFYVSQCCIIGFNAAIARRSKNEKLRQKIQADLKLVRSIILRETEANENSNNRGEHSKKLKIAIVDTRYLSVIILSRYSLESTALKKENFHTSKISNHKF